MPLFALIMPFLASAAQSVEPPITVVGRPWAPFISPMGEPFRARAADDDPLARWFHQADRNRDGMITAEEMQADGERFFATLDRNHDNAIDPDERAAYEWEIAPEVQVNSRWKRARGQGAAQPQSGDRDRGARGPRRAGDNIDGYQTSGLQGAARYGLLNIPQPVAGADADFNRAITLEEFRLAAAHRFRLLDSMRQGWLTLQQLEELLPSRPKARRRTKRKDAADTRIGLPLPERD
jgi:EF hand domain-containing protein